MKRFAFLFSILLFLYSAKAQHLLTLKTGEKMNGEVQSIKEGTLSFLFKGNTMNFKLAEISNISFNQEAPDEKKPAGAEPSGTKGVSYVMNGRKLTKQPTVTNLTMNKGIVVVAITIDKYGNIIKAEPGAEGTTTTDKYLLSKAQQAAESAHFDTGPTMPLKQEGTITISF